MLFFSEGKRRTCFNTNGENADLALDTRGKRQSDIQITREIIDPVLIKPRKTSSRRFPNPYIRSVQSGHDFNYVYKTLPISKVKKMQKTIRLFLLRFGERRLAIHFANVHWYKCFFNDLEGLVRA